MVEYRRVIGIKIFEKFCFSIRLILLDVETYVESIGLDTINGEDRVNEKRVIGFRRLSLCVFLVYFFKFCHQRP